MTQKRCKMASNQQNYSMPSCVRNLAISFAKFSSNRSQTIVGKTNINGRVIAIL